MTANYLEKEFGMPFITTTPMGVVDTAKFLRQITTIINSSTTNNQAEQPVSFGLNGKGTSIEEYIDQQTRFVSQAAWFSRSIDCQNLTGKKAIVFGDATHAASMTKIFS